MRTGVVELSSLTNAKTAAADDQHLLHIYKVPRTRNGTAVQVGLRIWRLLCLIPCLGDLGESPQSSESRR